MLNQLDRRAWLAGCAASTLLAPFAIGAETEFLDIIDCHTHFYDPTRPQGVPWPPENSTLYRKVMPENLRALKHYRRVTGTVIVEASRWVEDNQWLLDLAKDDPFIVGIVGNLNPTEADFKKNAKRFAGNPLFRGIRVRLNDIEEPLQPKVLDNLKLLADLDLSVDVNGGPSSPAVAAQLATKIPNLRIVQNHVGNVQITEDAPPKDWVDNIRAAAEYPNVYCKISALVEGAARQGKTPPKELDFYRPYIDVVWNAFGDDRVIYGSNWPVSDRAADYYTLQRIVMEYASEKGRAVTEKFCSLNAKQAYKWLERDGRLS